MVAPLAAAAIASAGLSAVGKILGGIGSKSAAKARAGALETNAGMDLAESGLAAQMGLEQDERVAASLATQAAAGGGGGLRGSALRVLNDLGRQSLQKARNTVYGGQTAAWSRRNDAQVARTEGRNALTGAVIGAGASLIGGAAKAYDIKNGGRG
ncbi:hypothetical protein [Phenylobacterium sp.]|jgi:hypothetical protein|uniref:hypothetical protein n=1 Tax=Phenylobacterium sp. TaxID=1871053 RepID=UPI0037CA7DD9